MDKEFCAQLQKEKQSYLEQLKNLELEVSCLKSILFKGRNHFIVTFGTALKCLSTL